MATQLRTTLKSQGYSLTETRQLVYDVLRKNEPLSMQQLIALLPNIDRSSVYRTIELFERLGITQKLQIGWKYRIELSNDYQEHHHHLTCLQCGRVTVLPEDRAIERQLAQWAGQHGFTPVDHQLEITGVCQYCAQPKNPETSSGFTRKPHTS